MLAGHFPVSDVVWALIKPNKLSCVTSCATSRAERHYQSGALLRRSPKKEFPSRASPMFQAPLAWLYRTSIPRAGKNRCVCQINFTQQFVQCLVVDFLVAAQLDEGKPLRS